MNHTPFKFRIYDRHNNEFLSVGVIPYYNKLSFLGILEGSHSQYIPSLYFGEGKDNQPIFQNDIIQLKNEVGEEIKVLCYYGKVIKEQVNNQTVEVTGFSFVLENGFPTFPILKNYLGVTDTSLFEVIGNIYQNPEMFKLKTV